jgi:hypothetical protein
MSTNELKTFFITAGVLGTAATWGRTVADGSLALLNAALDSNGLLPGTTSSVRETFTGIGPLDHLFRTLVVFFWEALDGSHPATTAAGVYFVGQLFPIIVAIYLDGLRSGNGNSALKPSLWFLVFGAAAIGSSGAVWGLLYVTSSPLASPTATLVNLQRNSMFSSPRFAACVLPAVFFGYVIPVIIMGLPSPAVVSNNFQQWAIVAWNTFPFFVLGFIRLGDAIWNVLQPPKYAAMDVTEPKHAPIQLWIVRRLGQASIFIGTFFHIAVVSISFSAWLFPNLFNTYYVDQLKPFALAVPPISIEQVRSLGEGILGFMLWDQVFGYSLVLVVFLVQYRNAQRFSNKRPLGSWTSSIAWAAGNSLLYGPGSAAMQASLLRDEVLFDENIKESIPGKWHS